MKKIYILTLTLFSAFLNAQTVDVAGSSPTTGDIKEFFNDPVDGVLYGIGRVSNAGGQSVEGIVAWDGNDWVAKGDQSLLGGPLTSTNPNSITRNGDTLYAMGVEIVHSSGNPMLFLMYWDETASNWKNKSYGIFGNDYQLISYSDTLFIVGNVSGGLDLSEDISAYNSLGDMAYWNGSRWEKYNSTPSFNQNPKGAVVVSGALYVEDYKYEAGVWTNIGPINGIESMGKWGSKVIYGTYETGTYYIKSYDGNSVSTIGIADAGITGITEYDSKLAVCGLNLGDIDGNTIKKIGAFDGTTWTTLFPSYIGGTGVHTVGGYYNQLIASAEDGGFYNTQSTPFSIGSIVLIGGSLQVGINDNEINNSLKIYPNPNQTGLLNISSEGKYDVTIFNINGQLIKTISNQNEKSLIDISDLQQGVYFVQIVGNDNHSTQKLIIK